MYEITRKHDKLWLYDECFGHSSITLIISTAIFIAIIKGPTRYWKKQVFHDILSVCIIMHNIIIEDEFDTHGSIVDLNVMFVSKFDMIVDKTEQFQWFPTCHK